MICESTTRLKGRMSRTQHIRRLEALWEASACPGGHSPSLARTGLACALRRGILRRVLDGDCTRRRVIPLLAGNARYVGGTIIPHLNFSIPCAALEPVFRFSETRDATLLECLDRPNKLLSSVWALVPAESKRLEPGPESKKHGEGKGSHFSQFLAEKGAEITSLKELDHLKKMRLPSKI
ncbi:Glyoxysomal processing protease, glyoxysomal [Platanthera guangdongensis]|uniref:Glyoxysomal processing protease, glyoxysomal n=1 Tax=Platanthera guangdongensis TaxID=2320717 RepID=A0ABR2MKE4_9ASPA